MTPWATPSLLSVVCQTSASPSRGARRCSALPPGCGAPLPQSAPASSAGIFVAGAPRPTLLSPLFVTRSPLAGLFSLAAGRVDRPDSGPPQAAAPAHRQVRAPPSQNNNNKKPHRPVQTAAPRRGRCAHTGEGGLPERECGHGGERLSEGSKARQTFANRGQRVGRKGQGGGVGWWRGRARALNGQRAQMCHAPHLWVRGLFRPGSGSGLRAETQPQQLS